MKNRKIYIKIYLPNEKKQNKKIYCIQLNEVIKKAC